MSLDLNHPRKKVKMPNEGPIMTPCLKSIHSNWIPIWYRFKDIGPFNYLLLLPNYHGLIKYKFLCLSMTEKAVISTNKQTDRQTKQ